MRPIHIQHQHREQQLSTTRLSPTEAAGDLARSLGLYPHRQMQVPRCREVGPAHVGFVWPLPSRHHPHQRHA
jgi:hypothetical protein